ncbi:GyrI-like domain-containing protein [Paenibacillus sp. NPDC058071]|uniref:GyrI-like domain-containing protein n=1 Tax=Paenibacillus sp. NPDC058071 TaxID=3346326 RepID=UPI0036DCEA67
MKLTIINSVRTNNFKDELLLQKISGLWKEAYDRTADQDSTLYGVYHQYESDYKGDYTLCIAVEGEEGERQLELPASAKYEIFRVDTAEEQGVVKTWQKIWRREEAGTLKRAYTCDFEKYDSHGEIDIYIAIK